MNEWINDLQALLLSGRVSVSQEEILKHGRDAWSVSIKTRQQDKQDFLPEGVVYPETEQEVAKLLAWASEHQIPVTPWGAGSAVTGSPLPLSGGISLDMSRLDKIISVNETDLTVTVQAGVWGDRLENHLNQRGLTLNHSPQSLDASTAGGWVATRSTGQFSSRYGGIEDLLLGVNVVLAGGGIVQINPTVRASMGPDLKQFFMGAEGTMGVITEVTLKIFRVSGNRIFEAIRFDAVLPGIETMRKIMQDGLQPFLVRFYDEDESRYATKDETFSGCVMFLGFEGIETVARAEYEAAMAYCKEAGGVTLGPGLVQAWMQRRFDYSTVENIINRPAGVAETVEVAHFWSGIYETYLELKKALAESVEEVLGHFSHAYPQGTSLYMILLSPKGSESSAAEAEETLRQIWTTVHEVTSRTGAMAAHHHGVGIARLPVIREELGTGMTILEQVKHALDPSGVLCPGKLGLP